MREPVRDRAGKGECGVMSEQASAGLLVKPDDRDYAAARGLWRPRVIVLRDGTLAQIRPLLPTDGETVREVFRRLSPDSRRRRFLQTIEELDEAMMERLVGSVDGEQHVGLVLTVLPLAGPAEPAGVAHLLQDPAHPAIADIAVTVVDRWQRRGGGGALASALLERRPAAVTRLATVVEAGNQASLALLARTGRMSAGLPHAGVTDVTVDLPPPDQPQGTVHKIAGLWAHATRNVVDQAVLAFRLPPAGWISAVEGYVEVVQQTADINRDLAARWIQAAAAVTAARPPG
jgi:RimJ/RimL family protein N-acetyltransferase